jgi:hypothetical protein
MLVPASSTANSNTAFMVNASGCLLVQVASGGEAIQRSAGTDEHFAQLHRLRCNMPENEDDSTKETF